MPAIEERVEAACETELSRIGSEKLLLAATGADIGPATVAGAVVATTDEAATQVGGWADLVDDEAAASLLSEAATGYRDIHDLTVETWPDATGESLIELEDPDSDWARVGAGLVGVGLVLDRLLLQAISYHVNEANAGAADRLRGFRADVNEVVDLVSSVDESDHEEAVEGAVAVIGAAYDRYVARLDAMGLDPKPLC